MLEQGRAFAWDEGGCGWYAEDPSGTTQHAFISLREAISVAGQPLEAGFVLTILVAG